MRLKNPQDRKSRNSFCLSNSQRKAASTVPTALLRSLKRIQQVPLTTNVRIARIRKAQGKPTFEMAAFVAREYTRPPNPDPQVVNEFANDRRLSNHCETMGTVELKERPTPRPKKTPWVRMRCQIWMPKDAPMRALDWMMTPNPRVNRDPK